MSVLDNSSRIGCAVEEIDTPALLVDYDILSDNIKRMARHCADRKIGLRPHAKAHKTATIARMQIDAGALGICCQKPSEAEAIQSDDISSILLSNEVVGSAKFNRLIQIARRSQLIVAVDNAEAASLLSSAFVAGGLRADVVVDVDLGQNRCGVEPGQPAAALAASVERLPGLRLRGIQAYQGKLQHIVDLERRNKAARDAQALLEETIDAFRRRGLNTEIVSGAGTGTYECDSGSGLFTEIQPGSYIFMDAHYRSIGGRGGALYDDFRPSLSVLASVVSTPKPDRFVVDSGVKALSSDSGIPELVSHAGWTFAFAGDEHGLLQRQEQAAPLRLGDKVRILPSHCDTTVNLYDFFHVTRNGKLLAVWPIQARGRVQ